MPHRQFLMWAAYQDQYGPIDLGRRGDVHTAMVRMAVLTAGGAKSVQFDKQLPQWRQRAPNEGMDFGEVLNAFQGK